MTKLRTGRLYCAKEYRADQAATKATMTTNDQVTADVLDAFQGLVQASKALDAHRYFAYIDTGRFTGLSAEGKAWHGFKDLEQLILAGFQAVERITSLEFSNVKVTVIDPSLAILVNEYEQTLLLKSGDVVKQAGGGTQVWSRTGDAWKLVSISASDARQREDAVF